MTESIKRAIDKFCLKGDYIDATNMIILAQNNNYRMFVIDELQKILELNVGDHVIKHILNYCPTLFHSQHVDILRKRYSHIFKEQARDVLQHSHYPIYLLHKICNPYAILGDHISFLILKEGIFSVAANDGVIFFKAIYLNLSSHNIVIVGKKPIQASKMVTHVINDNLRGINLYDSLSKRYKGVKRVPA